MTVSPGDIVRVDVGMIYDGDDSIFNTYQFKSVVGGGLTDTQALEDIVEIVEALYTIILAAINIIVVFNKINVFNKTQNKVVGQINFDTLTAGTQAGDALPPGACPVVTVVTDFPKLQLRKFLPPPSEASNESDGRIGAGAMALFASYMTALLSAHVATNNTWEYGYDSPVQAVWVVPTGAVIQDVWGYQRRRKQGVGS